MADKIIEDVEVLDVKDMERNQRERRNEESSTDSEESSGGERQKGAPVVWKALSIIVALVAAAYDLSPIDAVPDAMPMVGWIDDIGLTLVAILNLYQQFAKDQGASIVRFVRYIKWCLVALIALACIVVGGIIALIVHQVTQI